MNEFAPRKTIPQADRGSHLHQNGTTTSTRVQTERYNIGQTEISKRLPWNQIDVDLPLIPVTRTAVRGGRIIGGGTSDKAQRRAKRDLKARQG